MTRRTPRNAMVLAAGLGMRMRPITDTMPKPLVPIAGRTLLDRGLDTLAAAGVEKAVVNVHYLPQQIVAHVAARTRPRQASPASRCERATSMQCSDEELIESGGTRGREGSSCAASALEQPESLA